MENTIKLSRKIKKELKKRILSKCGVGWKTNEVRILEVKRFSRYKERSATYKGLTVVNYTLGVK